jgi:UDP-N-acetylmuramoyl-tripeptide--D-alanyl-D-alanine ligase
MIGAERIASAVGAEVEAAGPDGGPARIVIDSRAVQAGDLFVGLPGERADGGEFGKAALEAGAWGVLVGTQWAREHAGIRERGAPVGEGWVLGVADPLFALQELARQWRRELGCRVVGITGSTGKTSVKDICAALLPLRVHASPENYNTEIGLPLAILAAPEGTEALVLEMGMRGLGQITELTEIAEPDVGVITNVGPVHMELLGSLEAIARAKAEIVAGLRDRGTAVVPVSAGLLDEHLARAPSVLRFGTGGDVETREVTRSGGRTEALVVTPAGDQRFSFPFTEQHNLDNALAAIAAGVALDLSLSEMAERAPGIVFSRLRGELVPLPGDSVLINDCYNANPVSMRAALDNLASVDAGGRRIAVLGEMRELGPDAAAYHREVGEHAEAYAPDVHVADAAAAADALEQALGEGDVVLVKGSRAVGLEAVAERLGT